MALVELAGAPVEQGQISMALRGRWVFEGRVTTQKLPAGSVNIVCDGGLTLSGFVDPGASGLFLDSARVRVVGGAGGLGRMVSGSFQFAQLRDPLQAILDASGEQLDIAISENLLGLPLRRWTMVESSCAAALEALAAAASSALGQAVRWRILPTGLLWMGAETWPTISLAKGDAIEWANPLERLVIVAVETPTLAPGVTIADVGRIAGVTHYIEPSKVRTWLTTMAA